MRPGLSPVIGGASRDTFGFGLELVLTGRELVELHKKRAGIFREHVATARKQLEGFDRRIKAVVDEIKHEANAPESKKRGPVRPTVPSLLDDYTGGPRMPGPPRHELAPGAYGPARIAHLHQVHASLSLERRSFLYAIEQVERSADALEFVAAHLDEAKRFAVTDDVVERLVGPIDGGAPGPLEYFANRFPQGAPRGGVELGPIEDLDEGGPYPPHLRPVQ